MSDRSIAIIPARGGSQRIPLKNILEFHGKPIIAHSILTARLCGLFDKVIVSTDDQRIASVARAYGSKIHQRSRMLAQDEVGTQEVTAAVLNWWTQCAHGTLPEFACCIYATAPMLHPGDLIAAAALKPRHSYVYVPGYFYFGHTLAFIAAVPIEAGFEMPFPGSRYIDINTEDDWRRAEGMYQEMKRPQTEATG